MPINNSPATPDVEHRITLRNSTLPSEVVTLAVTPDLVETRTVNYKTVDPVHAPGQIYAFANSSSRTFQLSGIKLVSRTQQEADANLNTLWLLRSWTTPAFGSATNGQFEYTDPKTGNSSMGVGNVLGQPPAVLLLSAYSKDTTQGQAPMAGHINRVPVVIQTLNIPYPSDIDYVPTSSNVPMPIIMTLDISLVETHSPREYETFDLEYFKKGILPGF